MVEAIRHAQAAGDWAHAARLLADNYVDLVFDGRKATLRALLAAFPAGAPEADAELALAFATGRLYDGLLDESGTHIAVGGAAGRDGARRAEAAVRPAAGQREALAGVSARRSRHRAQAMRLRSTRRRTDELARSNDHRASALMNLGIAELWSLQLDDARRDLEEALALARRIGRPYLEVGCLGHLALAAVLRGSPIPVGLRLSEEAVTIAEAHGWGTHRIVAPGRRGGEPARSRGSVASTRPSGGWTGSSVRSASAELETEPILHYARAFVRLGQGRLEEALAEFRAADRLQPRSSVNTRSRWTCAAGSSRRRR